MDENTFWVKLWMVLGAAAVAIVLIAVAGQAYQSWLMVTYGYCETSVPGLSTTKWIKCQ